MIKIKNPIIKRTIEKLVAEAVSVKFISFLISCKFVIDSIIDAQTWMIFSLGILGIREYSKIKRKPHDTVESNEGTWSDGTWEEDKKDV